MYALFLALVVASTSPEPTLIPELDNTSVVTVAQSPGKAKTAVLALRQYAPNPPGSAPNIDVETFTDLVPYATDINSWYQRNKADRRWRNGVGLTINFGFQRFKLTFGLGPVQFSFGGQPLHTVP